MKNEYAEKLIELYDDSSANLKSANSMEELQKIDEETRQQHWVYEGELRESREALMKTKDEDFDSQAFVLHCKMIEAEEHQQWMLQKRIHELKEQE